MSTVKRMTVSQALVKFLANQWTVDGSYLMLNTELVTAVAEGLKLIVVLIQHHGYASIGHLSETVGSERFGTWYRRYDETERHFQSEEVLPVDLAANARSYGIHTVEVQPGPNAIVDLQRAMAEAKASDESTVIHINSDPLIYAPDGAGWWDVPVAEESSLDPTRTARADYLEQLKAKRPLLG
ncbi:TPP-dependent trihydroxycyclohexane-1,2-dione (THcHDO) dehydratase [Microbacterium amylolyticum]|uniref:TPP-dependent trihydroxycyclohexane-1,2-dione (THcHDO) dehydratase n=1 Tax=Microbacterium amylolyticum TaxID=936337 RepID=A0ABS4ZGE7_9MICO|nr:TPP-dependent trihydroxycyclohexane-1,2-dione (THcHDO) dehydratase [Microbacterium amylolyticum]